MNYYCYYYYYYYYCYYYYYYYYYYTTTTTTSSNSCFIITIIIVVVVVIIITVLLLLLLQIVSLWDWIQPLLEFARNNVTVETLDDWGNFYSSISVCTIITNLLCFLLYMTFT